MKNLLILILTVCLISCEFQAKSFSEIGGILYTFQLPKDASQADVDKLQDILTKRIRTYVRQKPKFSYDKKDQYLSVGVPKSLTSKNQDLCKKLLLADGSVLMINSEVSYLKISKTLEEINELIKEEPLKIDGKTSEQFLFDVLELIPVQQSMPFIAVASISDTGLIMNMIKDERFQDKFAKDIIWAWKVDKKEMKAYLHAYSLNNMKVDESMIEKVKIDNKKSMSGYPALSIVFDETGSDTFEKMTTVAFPKKGLIHIFVSQKLIMSPTVQSPITGGEVQITGSNTEEIIFLKSIIESGRLPVSMELIVEIEK